jgi:phosphate/sulfate permease
MIYIVPVIMFFCGIGMFLIGRKFAKRFGEKIMLQEKMMAEREPGVGPG